MDYSKGGLPGKSPAAKANVDFVQKSLKVAIK
jgi:hypothetical protein